MTNLQKALQLEFDYLKQIQELVKKAGSQNRLSLFLYGNENTLQAKLDRSKKSSPYKMVTLLKILEDYDKKKAAG